MPCPCGWKPEDENRCTGVLALKIVLSDSEREDDRLMVELSSRIC
ncbi:MAG: hypothetical protein ACLUVG_10970 [Phocaeicola vulgatus]